MLRSMLRYRGLPLHAKAKDGTLWFLLSPAFIIHINWRCLFGVVNSVFEWPLENLCPLIVPAEYIQSGESGVWNLPHVPLKLDVGCAS